MSTESLMTDLELTLPEFEHSAGRRSVVSTTWLKGVARLLQQNGIAVRNVLLSLAQNPLYEGAVLTTFDSDADMDGPVIWVLKETTPSQFLSDFMTAVLAAPAPPV